MTGQDHQKSGMDGMPPGISGAFRRGVLWLLFLDPFFFLSYGLANHYAAGQDAAGKVGSLVFGWEALIPLWPWSIIPYWSIDLLYGLAFLCCLDRAATNRLGLRLLSAQLICVSAFFLWPLRFSVERPDIGGLFGALFDALTRFDLPYNQAPSLHIALLVIVWRQFALLSVPAAVRLLIHGWAILIGVSVLTTWQHHFIDVLTGMAVGLFCLWLWPEAGKTPLIKAAARSPVLALRYFAGAVFTLGVALIVALMTGGAGLLLCGLLCWLALALLLVAFNYAWAGAAGFQKQDGRPSGRPSGRQSLAARWLFAPYTLAARINAHLWTRRRRNPDMIAEGLWLGPLPTAREFSDWAKQRGGKTALFDLAAELPAPTMPEESCYDGMPCLDLVPIPEDTPGGGDLREAVRRLGALKKAGCEVWVACALGYSRSASVVIAWLMTENGLGSGLSLEEAIHTVKAARPRLVLGAAQKRALEALQ